MLEINGTKSFEQLDFSTIENIEAIANGIMSETKRALINNQYEEILGELKKLQTQFERIRNKLHLDDDISRSIYYFGKITSATQLVMDISQTVEKAASFERISHSYPIFKPVLLTIAEHSVITGKELRQLLDISSGSLSNFMKRISVFHLITVEKVGRDNAYSLTLEGRRLASQARRLNASAAEAFLPVSEISKILSAVAEELKKDVPNAAFVVASSVSPDISPESKKQIKSGVVKIFSAKTLSERRTSEWVSLAESKKEDLFEDYYRVLPRGEKAYSYL